MGRPVTPAGGSPVSVSAARRAAERSQALWVELEWRRCASDELYWINKYVWIPSAEDPRGRCRFNTFDYQDQLLDTGRSNRFIVALKARQIGLTTLGMVHILWLTLFRPGSTCLVVSKGQFSSNKNLAQARLAYQFLPDWMQARGPALVADSSVGMSFRFADGIISYIKAHAATSGVGAGETARFVLWDEAALLEPADLQKDVLRTLLPTTDAGGSMWIVSTARGAYNRFAELYRSAKAKDTTRFTTFFKPWSVSPFMRCSKDCGWCGGEVGLATPCFTKYDAKRRDFLDEPWKFYAEYPEDDEQAFRESGAPRFVGLPVADSFPELPFQGNLYWQDGKVRFEFAEDGYFHLATLDPDADGFYVVGADPAQGVGRDYSSAHVLTLADNGLPEIVGYYQSSTVEPTEFASNLNMLGLYFSGRTWGALMAVEDQGGQGALPISELHKHLEYPNGYQYNNPGTKRSRSTKLFAFPMTGDKRRAVIDRLAKYLAVAEDGSCLLQGIYPALRVELGQFVTQRTVNSEKYAADVGCHDDLVMSLAIALWILVEEFEKGATPTASIERPLWKQPETYNLKYIYDLRDARLAAEEEARQSFSPIIMGDDRI